MISLNLEMKTILTPPVLSWKNGSLKVDLMNRMSLNWLILMTMSTSFLTRPQKHKIQLLTLRKIRKKKLSRRRKKRLKKKKIRMRRQMRLKTKKISGMKKRTLKKVRLSMNPRIKLKTNLRINLKTNQSLKWWRIRVTQMIYSRKPFLAK